jgi:hypothetical protein
MNPLVRLASTLLLFATASGFAVAQNVDRVNAGGHIAVTATASKATFGLVARNTTTPTGNMVYIDHASSKIRVFATSITSYTIVNATTRTITGTCTISGVGGFTFTCTVVDNGEPGTADTFSIALSSGYTASGTLTGGNVQIHAPH